MKASVYIATSVDGFIARPNGDIDWLAVADEGGETEDYGYQEFIETVDHLVMGRNSFEKVLSFGTWPYNGTQVVVLSSRPLPIPEDLAGAVEWMSGAPAEVHRRLAERGAKHLYIDGGKTIQGFLAAGLIDELVITKIPVLIGDGLPLFGSLPHDVHLRHLGTKTYANGLVQSRYAVQAD